MSGLAERSKVNLDLWNLFFSHCHIRLNKPSENNDIGFSSFKKINFSKISHLNALGSKFDLDVKQVKVNLGS